VIEFPENMPQEWRAYASHIGGETRRRSALVVHYRRRDAHRSVPYPASVSHSVDSGYATHNSHTSFGRPRRFDLAAFPGCAIPTGFGHALRRIPNCGPGFCLTLPARLANRERRRRPGRSRLVPRVALELREEVRRLACLHPVGNRTNPLGGLAGDVRGDTGLLRALSHAAEFVGQCAVRPQHASAGPRSGRHFTADLVEELLRLLLPDPAAAPALRVLAAFASWRGNGALTRVALERALRSS